LVRCCGDTAARLKEDEVAASSNQETGDAVWPAGSLPAGTRAPAAVDQDQLSLM
jgi:hypothetical protein